MTVKKHDAIKALKDALSSNKFDDTKFSFIAIDANGVAHMYSRVSNKDEAEVARALSMSMQARAEAGKDPAKTFQKIDETSNTRYFVDESNDCDEDDEDYESDDDGDDEEVSVTEVKPVLQVSNVTDPNIIGLANAIVSLLGKK